MYESVKNATLPSEREHATQYIIKNKKFKKGGIYALHDWSHFRMTIDYPKDFEAIKFLIQNSRPNAGYVEYIVLLTKHFDIALKNMRITRNTGLLKSLKRDAKVKFKKHLCTSMNPIGNPILLLCWKLAAFAILYFYLAKSKII